MTKRGKEHRPRFPVRFPQSSHTVVMFLIQLESIPKYCLQGPIFKVDLIATKFQFFIPSNQVTICPTAPVVSCKNVKLCPHWMSYNAYYAYYAYYASTGCHTMRTQCFRIGSEADVRLLRCCEYRSKSPAWNRWRIAPPARSDKILQISKKRRGALKLKSLYAGMLKCKDRTEELWFYIYIYRPSAQGLYPGCVFG